MYRSNKKDFNNIIKFRSPKNLRASIVDDEKLDVLSKRIELGTRRDYYKEQGKQ